MAVPQKKTSKSKNRMRQAGKGFVRKNNISFDASGSPHISHNIIVKKEKKVDKKLVQE